MSSQDFKYKTQQGSKVPLIPIELSRMDKKMLTDALIDSGAATTLISCELGEALGLKHRGEVRKITGAGGKESIIHMHDLDVELMGEKLNFKFGLPQRRGDTPYTILGRDTIFERFEIKFRQKETMFTLSDY